MVIPFNYTTISEQRALTRERQNMSQARSVSSLASRRSSLHSRSKSSSSAHSCRLTKKYKFNTHLRPQHVQSCSGLGAQLQRWPGGGVANRYQATARCLQKRRLPGAQVTKPSNKAWAKKVSRNFCSGQQRVSS